MCVSGFFHSEVHTLVKSLALSMMCGGANYMNFSYLRCNIYGVQLKFFSFYGLF